MSSDRQSSVGGAGRVTRNSAYGTIAGLGTAFGSVVASVIVAHRLGVERTGVVAFALWVATVTAAVVDLGVQASLSRYLPEMIAAGKDDEARRLAGTLLRALAISCGVALLGFAAYALWRRKTGVFSDAETALWVLVGLACGLQALAGFTYGALRGLQRFDRLAAVVAMSVACQILGVAIGCMWFGTVGAMAGYCAGSAVPAALGCVYAGFRGAVSGEIGARVRRYALYSWAAALSSTFVWSRAELFFLHRSTGSAAVGLFTVGVTLANMAAQGSVLLTAGLLPYFAENFGSQALPRMKEAYAAATRLLAFLILPACFGMAALLPALLPMIYGRAFAAAVPAAIVMVLAASVAAVSSVATNVVMAMDRSDFIFASGAAAAVLAIVAGFTVIPAFGLIGAAATRAAMQIFAVALGNWFVFRRLRFPLPFAGLARLLLAAAICAIAARASLYLATGVAALALAVATGIVTYAAAVRALGALDPADADRLRAICRGLPHPLSTIGERSLALLSSSPAFAGTSARGASDAG